jgi:phosphoglycerate dehydrogenase-like enzyme
VRVWVPYADVVGQLPSTVEATVYDGEGPAPQDRAGVELYVTPYTFDRAPLELLATMPDLAVVQTLTAGYEHVLPFLPEGVRLFRAGGLHDTSTAELAVTLALAALRGIPEFVRGQDAHEWRHDRHESLADKTVLIVGYGGVGEAVERRLAGFEVEVVRVASRSRAGVHAVTDLPPLLPTADVVILTLPLTPATRGFVDAAFLARMRDGALLVNVARGPVVDTAALLTELTSGRLRAAVDVTDPEPPPPDHPLWTAPNLLMTPHVGGNTSAFLPRAHRLIVEQITRYANGEPLHSEVTIPRS